MKSKTKEEIWKFWNVEFLAFKAGKIIFEFTLMTMALLFLLDKWESLSHLGIIFNTFFALGIALIPIYFVTKYINYIFDIFEDKEESKGGKHE